MISYNTDGVKMPGIKKRLNNSWIKAVAACYGKKVGDIAYIFVNDEKILEVNRQFLQHDYYTDIIGIRENLFKNSMTMFMAEVLYRAIKDGANEEGLYEWCEKNILLLDSIQSDFSNFHIHFLPLTYE